MEQNDYMQLGDLAQLDPELSPTAGCIVLMVGKWTARHYKN